MCVGGGGGGGVEMQELSLRQLHQYKIYRLIFTLGSICLYQEGCRIMAVYIVKHCILLVYVLRIFYDANHIFKTQTRLPYSD